jgi:hypothetical protein
MSQSKTSGLHCGGIKDVQKFLVAHYDQLTELYSQVDPGETFRARDLDDHLGEVVDAWMQRGIVSCVGSEPLPEDDEKYINVYETHRRHREWVESYSPHAPELPCGHHGIRNAGGTITCTNDWCEEHYPTQVVKAFIERQ